MDKPKPLTVICRYCDERIALNEDSQEARKAGTDPYQQMRRHLIKKHSLSECANHARKLGWLIDALAFLPEDEGNKIWKARLHVLVDYFASPTGFDNSQ